MIQYWIFLVAFDQLAPTLEPERLKKCQKEQPLSELLNRLMRFLAQTFEASNISFHGRCEFRSFLHDNNKLNSFKIYECNDTMQLKFHIRRSV